MVSHIPTSIGMVLDALPLLTRLMVSQRPTARPLPMDTLRVSTPCACDGSWLTPG